MAASHVPMTRPVSNAPDLARDSLRACLVALTNALDGRAAEDSILVDRTTLRVLVDSRLDDVDRRSRATGFRVPPPDGLFEWRVRRNFVRSLPLGDVKRRLGLTLGGPKTRRRFELVVATARGEDLRRAFLLFRRRRLRSYAARVLRFALSDLAQDVACFISVYP